MATITTTSNTGPFQYPGARLICKVNDANRYMALVKASTADNYVLYRSTDAGATWGVHTTIVRTNLVDVGSIFSDNSGWLFWAYRTNESSQDRIYIRRLGTITPGLTSNECLLASPGNGGTPGSTYSGLDLITHNDDDGDTFVVVAVGTQIGANQGVTLHAGTIDAGSQSATMVSANSRISGTRQWLYPGTAGRVGVQIDKEHTGDGYKSSSPNLWVTFMRADLRVVKVPWSGSCWTGAPGSTLVAAAIGARDTLPSLWDGSRFLVVVPDPVTTDTVMLIERNRANSTSTTHRSPSHPTGVVRQATMSYNTGTQDVRVYAIGTSTAVLYYADYIRLTDTWTGWTTTGATIIGAAVDNFGVKISSYQDAKYGPYYATGTTPFTLTYVTQTLTYAPNTPTWASPQDGSAADVAATLPLAWVFSDYDAGDLQSAYAVSKQIGAGALSYWRASDSTWQPAEVQNTSGTSAITIPVSWAVHTDAAHTFKVKVWDSSSTASGYSAGLVVIPSTPINPAITAPTAAQVLTVDHVTTTWTATEQTQYRVLLNVQGGGAQVYDSGWVADAAARTLLVPVTLANTTLWTLTLQTRNNEGLPSVAQTVNFSISYIPPMTPTLTLAPLPAAGVIRATIANPTPGGGAPAVADQALWRRVVGDTSAGVRVAAALANNATFDDWQVVSGISYEFQAVTRGVNGTSTSGAWTS